jgi:hypothetical protein
VTHAAGAALASFYPVRRDRDYAPTRPATQPPAKARERRVSGASRNVEVGGERSELEGGSEGKGRPSADGRNSSAVRFAVGADVCGAIGCRETDGLLVVEQGGETRTLCPDHARRWSG